MFGATFNEYMKRNLTISHNPPFIVLNIHQINSYYQILVMFTHD